MRELVFQIGQNKTATLSISHLLNAAGYEVARWDGDITRTMWDNVSGGRPLLEGLERWNAFTDMDPSRAIQEQMWRDDGPQWHEHAGWALFEQMHAQHPNAYFIYNTRPRARWERSLAHHYRDWFDGEADKLQAYVARRSKARDAHEHAVRSYFARQRSARFLVVDIEGVDAGVELGRFLDLPPGSESNWKQLNKSGT